MLWCLSPVTWAGYAALGYNWDTWRDFQNNSIPLALIPLMQWGVCTETGNLDKEFMLHVQVWVESIVLVWSDWMYLVHSVHAI